MRAKYSAEMLGEGLLEVIIHDPINEENLERAMIAIQEYRDLNGKVYNLFPKGVVVAHQQFFTAERVLRKINTLSNVPPFGELLKLSLWVSHWQVDPQEWRVRTI